MLIKMAALTFAGNFVWIGCISEAQKEVTHSTQFPFIDELKYMISGVTSFQSLFFTQMHVF